MLKRTSITLLFAFLALAAAASAQAPDELMFHRTAAGGTEIIQRAVILPLPPPPPGPPGPQFANVPPAALPLAVAVEKYLVGLGYLQDGPYGMNVVRTDSGWTVTVVGPTGTIDFVIHSPGPTFPKPTDNIPRVLVSVLAIRYDISNGF